MGSEERLRVLKMLDEGKITADQAAQLIAALEGDRGAGPTGPRPGTGRTVRVVVTDMETGRPRVNVRLPSGLMDLALRFGARFGSRYGSLDLEDLMDAVHAGASGKLVDVTDESGGQRVEVFVE
jgi:hypothetical protein